MIRRSRDGPVCYLFEFLFREMTILISVVFLKNAVQFKFRDFDAQVVLEYSVYLREIHMTLEWSRDERYRQSNPKETFYLSKLVLYFRDEPLFWLNPATLTHITFQIFRSIIVLVVRSMRISRAIGIEWWRGHGNGIRTVELLRNLERNAKRNDFIPSFSLDVASVIHLLRLSIFSKKKGRKKRIDEGYFYEWIIGRDDSKHKRTRMNEWINNLTWDSCSRTRRNRSLFVLL